VLLGGALRNLNSDMYEIWDFLKQECAPKLTPKNFTTILNETFYSRFQLGKLDAHDLAV
jgi:hypothetical protein